MTLQARDIQFDIKGRDKTQAAFEKATQRAVSYQNTMVRATRATSMAEAAAARGTIAATNAMAAADRAAAFRKKQLAIQSLDVAQSLALGMKPTQVAIAQGGQLAGIYAGQGGLAQAAKEAAGSVLLFAAAHPVAIAAAAATGAAFLGMAHEIETATGKSVGFGDVAIATFQVVRDGIANFLHPAIAAIAPWFSQAWGWVVESTKGAINGIVRMVKAGVEVMKFTWTSMKLAISGPVIEGVNLAIDAINKMVLGTRSLGGKLREKLGFEEGFLGEDGNFVSTAGNGGLLGKFGHKDVSSVQKETLAAALRMQAEIQKIHNTDYAGEFYEAVKTQVIAGLNETEEAASAAGKAIKSAANDNIDPWKNLRLATDEATDGLEDARQSARSFLGDIVSGFREGQNAAEVFAKAIGNLANRFVDRGLDMFVNALFPIPGNAMGTSNWRGGLTWVGERGPEIVNLPRGSQVIPNHDIGRYMQSSKGNGGIKIINNIHNSVSGAEVQTRQRQAPNGDIILDTLVSKSIASGNQDKAMSGRFGMKSQPLGVG